jgi:alpha-1,3-glucosyltransferase
MHGFVLAAIAFAMRDHFATATFFMVLAVNFKQTALYFALPFVVYTVARLMSIHHNSDQSKLFQDVLTNCIILGAVFIFTNGILWLPWLGGAEDPGMATATEVWNRVFPVRRGIFEDKVASFWCVIHYCTPLKPNNWFDRSFQFKMTMGTTLLTCVPSCFYLFKAPTRNQFLYCLFCVSLCFFMFGFQVHEKQILSPGLMIALLFAEMPRWQVLFCFVCNFSMWDLYWKDHNVANYLTMQFATLVLGRWFESFVAEMKKP